MDNFQEEIIVRKNRTMFDIVYMLSYVIMIISAGIALVSFQGLMAFNENWLSSLIPFAVFGGCAVLIWFGKDKLRVEYEYTFTNGEMDFAQVLNNSKRKHLCSFNIKNIERMAPVEDGMFDHYGRKDDVRKLNLVLNRNTKQYFLYLPGDKGTLLVWEPSEEMVRLVAQYAGKQKVIV